MRLRFEATDRWTVSTGDVVWIEKAKETFDMVRLGDASFFDKMRSKLNRN